MYYWQAIADSLKPAEARLSNGDVLLRVHGGPEARFKALEIPALTVADAEQDHKLATPEQAKGRYIIVYEKSSPEARTWLRKRGISYVGRDGYAFVQAPGLLIDRDERTRLGGRHLDFSFDQESGLRNPFSMRASRVARWLLLHPNDLLSISDIAVKTGLNSATVSRVIQALEESAFVSEPHPDATGRRRLMRLDRPMDILDAWLPVWHQRRIKRQRWDIGVDSARSALERLRWESMPGQGGWALGGLAGAALHSRHVEPVDVQVWVKDVQAVEALQRILEPLRLSRARQGSLLISVAPDPWTLRLAKPAKQLPVVDQAQLWLDCSSQGERALEAAEGIAREAGWR